MASEDPILSLPKNCKGRARWDEGSRALAGIGPERNTAQEAVLEA